MVNTSLQDVTFVTKEPWTEKLAVEKLLMSGHGKSVFIVK